MLIIDCFGHNIYVDKDLIGYIQANELIISGRKFADITDDGIISFGEKYSALISIIRPVILISFFHDKVIGIVAEGSFRIEYDKYYRLFVDRMKLVLSVF